MGIFWEIVGYIGTALVLISMMMTSVRNLRIFNLIGSFISTVYALVAGTYPVVFLNGGIVIIHIYHFIRAYRLKKLAAESSDSSKNIEKNEETTV